MVGGFACTYYLKAAFDTAPLLPLLPLLHLHAFVMTLLFLGLTNACVFAFVGWDTIKNRRLHPAFGWGTLFFLVSQPARILQAHTAAWNELATWLVA